MKGTKGMDMGVDVTPDAGFDGVVAVLRSALELEQPAESFTTATPLLGSLPELDSMAVVVLVAALEERFGIEFDDDEITGDVFETVGSLAATVAAKRG